MVEMVERLGTPGPRAKAALDDAADTCNAIVDARRVMNRCRLAAEGGVDVGAEERRARARERRRRSREV